MDETKVDLTVVICSEGGKWHKTILNCPTRVGYIQECLECGKEFGASYDRVHYPQGIVEP